MLLMVLLILPFQVNAREEAGTSATLAAPKSELKGKNKVDADLKKKVMIEVLSKYNAPLLSEVDSFMDTCIKYDLDCYLLPSISGVESTFGRFTYAGSHNPFGWGGGYIMFDSWKEGIETVGKTMRTNYMNKWNAESIDEIAPIYAESPTWAQKVHYFHDEFMRVEDEKRLYFAKLKVEL